MNDEYNFLDNYKDSNEIEDNIWLGNYASSENIRDLKEKGITKILTVINGPSSNYFYKEHGFIHKAIDIRDYEDENIIQYFGECLNFIKGDE